MSLWIVLINRAKETNIAQTASSCKHRKQEARQAATKTSLIKNINKFHNQK